MVYLGRRMVYLGRLMVYLGRQQTKGGAHLLWGNRAAGVYEHAGAALAPCHAHAQPAQATHRRVQTCSVYGRMEVWVHGQNRLSLHITGNANDR